MRNKTKEKLRAGKAVIGCVPVLEHPLINRILGASDFDFMLVDGQHGAVGPDMLRRMIMNLGDTREIIVRVTYCEPWLVNQALDAGADGVILPLTETPEDVAKGVAGAKYPPKGDRSWGPWGAPRYGGHENYAKVANDEVIVWPQIESAKAVENIDKILQVEGIDGIMIGPADLGWSMGYMPHEGMEQVDQAIQHVLDRCKALGVPWGMFTGNFQLADKWLSRGGKIGTVGSDLAFFSQGLQSTMADVNELMKRVNG